MRIKTFGLLLFIAPLFAISCSKGNAGATGPAGPAGAAGPSGPQGPAGSANVIYSDWFTPASYKKDTVFGSYGFNFDKAVATITQQIVDSGVVITYGKLDGYNPVIWPANQVEALPIQITYLSGATANIDTWSALITPGNLRIRLVSSLNEYGSISNAHQFRYVIIPGGVKNNASVKPGLLSGSGQQLNTATISTVAQNYQQMSYAQVCGLLNIPQ